MSESLLIRRATAADAGALARVRTLSWQTAYRGLLPDQLLDGIDLATSTARFRERLDATDTPTPEGSRNHARDHLCLQADAVVGWSSWGPTRDEGPNQTETAELYALYVLPQCFGLGAGYALMSEVLRDVETTGHYDQITLWVLSTNVRGISFYTRQGFKADGETKTVSLGPDIEADEVRYRKELRLR